MKATKLISILCTAAMMTAAFSGCAADNGKTTSSAQPPPSKAAESKADGAPASPGEFTLPITPEVTELSYAGVDSWYPPASLNDNLPVWQEYEKRTNIKIKWELMPSDQYDTTMQTRVAAGQKLPDMMAIPPLWGGDVVKYADGKVILPLKKLIDENAPDIVAMFKEYPIIEKGLTAPDGDIYNVSEVFIGGNMYNPRSALLRKDWLDKLKLEVPKTIDDWYNVLKAFSQNDPNGNGKKDEVAISSRGKLSGYDFLATAFGLEGGLYNIGADGKLFYTSSSPQYKEYLTFLNKLYKEGIMDPDFTLDIDKFNTKVSQNLIGCSMDFLEMISGWDGFAQASGDKTSKYIAVAPPIGKDGKEYGLTGRDVLGMQYGLSKDCKDPVSAIKWIDYVWANTDGVRLQSFGVEGTSWKMGANGKPELTEFVTNNPDGLSRPDALRSLGALPPLFDNQSVERSEVNGAFEGLEVVKPYIRDPIGFGIATLDEGSRFSSLNADIKTTTDEMTEKFIFGTEPLENYDKYVKQLEAMGLADMVAIMQARYDRANK